MTPTAITSRLASAAFTADEEFLIDTDKWHSFNLNGDGIWQYWDGAAWQNFADGSGKNFQGKATEGGRIKLAVTSGTVTAGFKAQGTSSN